MGAVHSHADAQGTEHGTGGAGFAAGQKLLRIDLRILVRPQEAVLQKERMGSQDLSKQIRFRFHDKTLLEMPKDLFSNSVNMMNVRPSRDHSVSRT